MINTPETIWATDNYDWFTFDCNPDLPATQYIRADIADARVKAAVEAERERCANMATEQAHVFRNEAHDQKQLGSHEMYKRALMIASFFDAHAAAIRAGVPE